jgi:hypothetical protein
VVGAREQMASKVFLQNIITKHDKSRDAHKFCALTFSFLSLAGYAVTAAWRAKGFQIQIRPGSAAERRECEGEKRLAALEIKAAPTLGLGPEFAQQFSCKSRSLPGSKHRRRNALSGRRRCTN